MYYLPVAAAITRCVEVRYLPFTLGVCQEETGNRCWLSSAQLTCNPKASTLPVVKNRIRIENVILRWVRFLKDIDGLKEPRSASEHNRIYAILSSLLPIEQLCFYPTCSIQNRTPVYPNIKDGDKEAVPRNQFASSTMKTDSKFAPLIPFNSEFNGRWKGKSVFSFL